jgi:hypothetical protein
MAKRRRRDPHYLRGSQASQDACSPSGVHTASNAFPTDLSQQSGITTQISLYVTYVKLTPDSARYSTDPHLR